jgi:hypothetical protein
MKSIIIKACATWLFAAAPALHAAAVEDLPIRSTEDVEVVFKALDRNSDSKISRSEATVKGRRQQAFRRYRLRRRWLPQQAGIRCAPEPGKIRIA